MITISRRHLVAGMALAASPPLAWPAGAATASATASADLAGLERRHGGRLGVAILNLGTGARAGHRLDERFLLCSTFKTLLAALVLARVDRGEEALDHRVVVRKADLVAWAPVTKTRLGRPGMTVSELCEATVTQSDNGAANLLLARVGGPAGVTAFLRSIGDTVTRLDRVEPALNEHEGPGDERDTTTPAAMLETLRALAFGDVLSDRSRSQFLAWHILNKTGDRRLRAGLPAGWLVGDKTGTNGSGTSNDVGVAWPADRGPVIVTAYCEMPTVANDTRDAVLAEVGRIAATV